jgi:hypothetical protein
MNELEIRALSDEALESEIKALEPTTRQRTREGWISPEAGKALGELLPFTKERDRRQEAAKREKALEAARETARKIEEQHERTRQLLKLTAGLPKF